MRRRRMHKVLWIVLILLVAVLFGVFYLRLRPVVHTLSKACVANEASLAVNRSVNRQIAAGQIDYEKITLLEKDGQGRITAIRTNMAEVNRLKTEILRLADEEVMELSVSEIGLPLGTLFFPEFLSGKGPRLPIRVLSVSSSDAVFTSEFCEAGINQTLHRILLNISLTMTILTPVGTQSVTAESQVIVAETAIVGTVPGTYLNLESAKE